MLRMLGLSLRQLHSWLIEKLGRSLHPLAVEILAGSQALFRFLASLFPRCSDEKNEKTHWQSKERNATNNLPPSRKTHPASERCDESPSFFFFLLLLLLLECVRRIDLQSGICVGKICS